MDFEAQVGELGLTSCRSINKNPAPADKKDQSSPPSILDKDLTPITPDSSKETLQSSFHHMEGDDGPSTPREGVFDPEQLIMAPHCLKYLQESRSYVARRLKFEFGKCEGEFDDDLLVETMYDSLLEAIISKQAEDILAEIYVLKTPPSAPRLTNTCPGAPLKPVRKSRNIDLSLCRKLEF